VVFIRGARALGPGRSEAMPFTDNVKSGIKHRPSGIGSKPYQGRHARERGCNTIHIPLKPRCSIHMENGVLYFVARSNAFWQRGLSAEQLIRQSHLRPGDPHSHRTVHRSFPINSFLRLYGQEILYDKAKKLSPSVQQMQMISTSVAGHGTLVASQVPRWPRTETFSVASRLCVRTKGVWGSENESYSYLN